MKHFKSFIDLWINILKTTSAKSWKKVGKLICNTFTRVCKSYEVKLYYFNKSIGLNQN
jgi:hypothetical protein